MNDVIMRRVRKGNQSPSQYCPNCEAQAAEIEKLRAALLEHNNRLHTAASIALREGAQTNWPRIQTAFNATLAEYHDMTNAIRKTFGEPIMAHAALEHST